jgi:hypothetical protein
VPEQFDVDATEGQAPFILLKDFNPGYPNFEDFLYMSLDF